MPGRVELSVANFQLAQYPIAIVDSEISWLERGVMFVQELLYSVARPWMTQPFDKIEKPAVNRYGAAALGGFRVVVILACVPSFVEPHDPTLGVYIPHSNPTDSDGRAHLSN